MSHAAAEPKLPIDRHFDCMKKCQMANTCSTVCSGLSMLAALGKTVPSEITPPEDQRASHCAQKPNTNSADAGQMETVLDKQVGDSTEAHPIAPPAMGTPRTPYMPRTEAEYWVEPHRGPVVYAWEMDKMERELAAANERLNAKVPEVEDMCRRLDEADRGRQVNTSHVRPFSLFGMAADKLRDLRRRLAEALKRADHAYPYPEAEDWSVEELTTAYGQALINAGAQAQRIGWEVKRVEAAESMLEAIKAESRDRREKLEAAESARDEAVAKERDRILAAIQKRVRTTTDPRYCNILMLDETEAAIRGSSEGGGNG